MQTPASVVLILLSLTPFSSGVPAPSTSGPTNGAVPSKAIKPTGSKSVAMPTTGAVPSAKSSSAVAVTSSKSGAVVTTQSTSVAVTEAKSICYQFVGCFDNYPPFDNAGYDLPDSPDKIGTKFFLYTRRNPKVGHVLDYRNVSTFSFNFNKSRELKVITHGFSQDATADWVVRMKDGFLKLDDFNVITVDWKKGAEFPNYDQAVANTRVVSTQIKLILDILVKAGLKLKDVHLLGHSLGAHASGYTGFLNGGKIRRISGMDPAEPSFEHKLEIVRLDRTDAMFVDVIHTNGAPILMGGAGLMQESGHVDFFVNGGETQPGCKDGIGSAIGGFFSGKGVGGAACSHGRSHEIYVESLSAPCPFTAYPCDNYDDFNKGKCLTCGRSGCSQLGYYADQYSARGDLYLKTAAKKPFCGFHYIVEIKTNLGKNTKGILSLNLSGKWGNTGFIQVTGDDRVANNSLVKRLVVSPDEVGDLTSLQFRYVKHTGFWMGTGEDTIKIQSIKVTSGENGYSYLFCFDKDKDIANNAPTSSKITTKQSCP